MEKIVKAWWARENSNQSEEVNYCSSTSLTERITSEDTHILTVGSTIESEVLLTTEEPTSWLLDSGTSYHVIPFWSHFQSYTARDFEPVQIRISKHSIVIGIGSIELVQHVLNLWQLLISVGVLEQAVVLRLHVMS